MVYFHCWSCKLGDKLGDETWDLAFLSFSITVVLVQKLEFMRLYSQLVTQVSSGGADQSDFSTPSVDSLVGPMQV